MAVRVGSARSDENRQLVNGKEGDQRQTSVPDMSGEVSMEPWYLHQKGWYIIRVKDPTARKKVAYAMEAACNNKHIGYSQSNRWTAQEWCRWNNGGNYDPAAITKDVNVDCSALVRLCLMYAGIDVGDVYTSNMPQVLGARSEFELISDKNITDSSDYVYAGDILCTRSSGHTVVVLDDGPKTKEASKYKYVYKGIVYDNEFDPTYYADRYPDLKKAFGYNADRLLEHWVNYGIKEKRIAKANPTYVFNGVDYTSEFDPIYYADRYSDLKAAFGYDSRKLLQHWVEFGKREKRVAKAPAATVVDSGIYGTAKTSMTVRNEPHTSGKILGYVNKAQKVKVLEKLSNGWLKIEWNGGIGYTSNVNGQYYDIVEPVVTAQSAFPCTVKITADLLYIRKGPGTEYTTNGVVKKNEKYVIVGIEKTKWGKLQNGKGYISMAYAEKV